MFSSSHLWMDSHLLLSLCHTHLWKACNGRISVYISISKSLNLWELFIWVCIVHNHPHHFFWSQNLATAVSYESLHFWYMYTCKCLERCFLCMTKKKFRINSLERTTQSRNFIVPCSCIHRKHFTFKLQPLNCRGKLVLAGATESSIVSLRLTTNLLWPLLGFRTHCCNFFWAMSYSHSLQSYM